ncbi:MAG: hypothetical protein HRU13_07455 [Phycisphaerales bacterium]|nr:hypothetical protein [Phycisphaerales bacterium]
MTLFQRFMRVLTHPQHAGEPMPAKKPRKTKPAAVAPAPMKVAEKAPATTVEAEDSGVSVAVASTPKIPTTPQRPVEIFAPDRESSDEQEPTEPIGTGSLLDDLDDSSLGLEDAEPVAIIEAKPAENAPEPSGPELVEVFDLIEKLRDHVDAQNGRFEQAMGVLDQIKTSAAALPEIRERIDTMLASIDELKANQFKGHEKVERALAAQSARLDTIAQAIERATEREERLATSLVEINQTILSVSTTNDRLASVIDAMRRHEAERDARIGRALTGAQRWLVVLTLVMGAGMVATIITAILASG